MCYRTILLVLILGFCFTAISYAQNEVMREQDSLYGIQEFGVVVNIEKPNRLDDEISLKVDSVRSLLLKEIDDLPVTILEDQTLRESDQFPILHLHINVMYTEIGVYPFTAELKFYQPVKLPLNKDNRTMGATWHDSFIGVVSPDLINYIAQQSVNLTGNFRDAYWAVN
ncbi:hypothetical protein [Gracilimonas mengyeensis]|uniref:Uncharacterized protein n=1 Tax=Gracilimonas mengyeensis TaxID=1302730 RepID=A0A521CWJ7_9BACT|nr:hypothetical protein [Gracilimonas mengyeensis]SMO63792.1 hypothetical protein SAMN06265219_106168 [Gracilimonas mengyeensis]